MNSCPSATLSRLAGILLLLSVSPPGSVAADRTEGFCLPGHKLSGAYCIDAQHGKVSLPQTKGPAYAQLKMTISGGELCSLWDIHVTTQIEDFGAIGTVSSDRLASAGLMQAIANSFCKQRRFPEAMTVYESISAILD